MHLNTNLDDMPPPINLSLEQYTGNFGAAEASHLVRRTTFVHSVERRNEAIGLGLSATVEKLLEVQPLPEPPLNFRRNDTTVPYGETWVNELFNILAVGPRANSLLGWSVEQMAHPQLNIREKMVLFWHNHFPVL